MEESSAVAKVRSFNRFYTNVLGLLDNHILGSDFTLTEARVLLEIAKSPNVKAREIGLRLRIDPSYLSRVLRRFEARGLMTKSPCEQDGRYNDLRLTGEGEKLLDDLGARSDAQISSLLDGLSPAETGEVLAAMALIRDRFAKTAFPAVIRPWREGDAAYIVRRHEELYLKEYGLSAVFAAYVRRLVGEMAAHFDPERECVLIPELDGRRLGSVAIVKHDEQTAQFRFFLLEPEARGYGLGLRLMEEALAFCRGAGYRRVFLETISILTAARSIYRRAGFAVTQTHLHADWGREVLEERWEKEL
jgi:DNA-binding MarR family transcriptional regulator/N-acetylglutamate synthase-like GNAT family acetyltransferase